MVSFDEHISIAYKKHSSLHWCPDEIAVLGGELFKTHGIKNVLDIGSGIGKFCLIAEEHCSAQFTGIEIRSPLVSESNRLKSLFNSRTQFICDSILQFDFDSFDAFFYYHPFCEQEALSGLIDHDMVIDTGLLETYENDVRNKLNQLPTGTTLLTFRSPHFNPPSSFKVLEILENEELILWKN
jgi:hypothetical protein